MYILNWILDLGEFKVHKLNMRTLFIALLNLFTDTVRFVQLG